MQSAFDAAINQICEEKHLDKAVVVQAIESAIAAAYRKEKGTEFQKIEAIFDSKTGMVRIFNLLEVVDDIEYPDSQILLKNARKQDADMQIGDRLRIEVTPEDEVEYGRIAAQTAKQVIIQRLQEAERDAMYSKYKDRQGEVINAQVQRVEGNNYVFLSIEGATVVLYPEYQIPREKYFIGQRLKVYIAEVKRTSKGPSIIVSRTHSEMIAKLLELEVPEIQEGNVKVEKVAREPGVRTKVAVSSTQESIDPVGSCVGQRGVRIQAITSEIGDEKIDIIEFSNNPATMIINALSPAHISALDLLPGERRAKVYVLEDQRSLAIGKSGQNVRLASKLLHWEIDILDFIEGETKADTLEKAVAKFAQYQPESQVDAEISEEDLIEEGVGSNVSEIALESLSTINAKILTSLQEAGIMTVNDLKQKTVKELVALPSIGQKTAEKIQSEIESL